MSASALIRFAIVVTACLAYAPVADAQRVWAFDRFVARDVDPGSAATFRDLLRNEVSSQGGLRVIDLNVDCPDIDCALQAARGTGAETAVHATLGRLGSKVVVSFTAADVATGQVRASDTIGVDRLEELDLVAKRVASAMLGGTSAAASAELGTVTRQEARAPNRRDSRFAIDLGLSGILPFSGYADRQPGGGFQFGLWFETLDLVIEPRFGYRSELTRGESTYDHIPFELGLYYLLSRADISPLIGAGLGLHYLDEDVAVTRTVGDVLVSTTTGEVDDDVMGVGVFARLGVMLMRTYDVSVLCALDYAVTFADFQERSQEQALRLELAVIIGGS